MPKNTNQKLKLLYLQKLLLERTDEQHSLTMEEILAGLRSYGIEAERKSIYDDLEALRLYGIEVERRGRQYAVLDRTFQLPELKLLVDAVQSSKFITHKKSAELIEKVERLASQYEAQALQRQVYVANRIKTMNESIYYNVDTIHNAISAGSQITYQYFEWTPDREKRPRHNGKRYQVSPWALTWDDENYYMIGYDSQVGGIRHYRVDKMLDIRLTGEKRDGQAQFERFDMAVYSKKMFGMFSGEEELVRLQFCNHLAGVVIDRFGADISILRTDSAHFAVTVRAAISPQFFSWLFGFGDEVEILSPASVIVQYQEQLQRVLASYRSNT
ncbi:MAG: WYL domain-containing protein [Anaerotruncus sp.]|jgi:predicted DNA-binding transcriptional regulator YafY|nr:WYL domain-containing protein [Anaerotruncus sp.]